MTIAVGSVGHRAPASHNSSRPSGVAAPSYNATVLADGPVSFWPLNETTGTVAGDAAGGGHPGTYTGGFTLGQTGIGDGQGAVLFNGTTGLVSVPFAATLQPALVTAEVWVNVPALQSPSGYLTSNDFTANVGYAIGDGINGVPGVSMVSFHGGWNTSGTPGQLSVLTWHHVVGTYDGANLRVYVDGSLAAGPAACSALTYDATALIIGRAHSAGFTSGTIAKAAVYNKVLTPAQIATHYAARTNH